MDITSIDNIVNPNGDPGDGQTLLAGQLARLRAVTTRADDVLVAIIPEYEHPVGGHDPAGRLLRLNVLTCNFADLTGLSADEAELFEASLLIVTQLQAKRAAAYKALNDAPRILPVRSTPDRDKA